MEGGGERWIFLRVNGNKSLLWWGKGVLCEVCLGNGKV